MITIKKALATLGIAGIVLASAQAIAATCGNSHIGSWQDDTYYPCGSYGWGYTAKYADRKIAARKTSSAVNQIEMTGLTRLSAAGWYWPVCSAVDTTLDGSSPATCRSVQHSLPPPPGQQPLAPPFRDIAFFYFIPQLSLRHLQTTLQHKLVQR